MAEDIDVVVTGLPELAETLDIIPIQLSNLILRESLVDGGEVVADAVRAAAPVAAQQSHLEGEPGELRDSIIVAARVYSDKNYGIAHIGPEYDKGRYSKKTRTHSPGVYAKFVEYGTRLMDAHPFMRPAFQAAKTAAVEAFGQGIARRMDKLISAVRSLSKLPQGE
ncbi:MAG: HK97 gp10 family phage protein [Acidobacteriia bacterium]|nr:HK97 gp10 family phage protein [Terriglobia bacterium]